MWLDGPLISRSFHLCHTASGVCVYVCVFIYIYLFFFLWQPSAALRVELASVLWPGSCSCAASHEPGALVVEVVWGFDTGLPRGVLGFDGKETELCPLKTEVAQGCRFLCMFFSAVLGQHLKPSSSWGPPACKGCRQQICKAGKVHLPSAVRLGARSRSYTK